jgi:hypothetical protein
MPGTFVRLWTLLVTLLTASHIVAQVPPTHTQTSARKAMQPNLLARQAATGTAATQAGTKAVSKAPTGPKAVSGTTNSILHQLKSQATPGEAKTVATGGKALSEQIGNLEPTGQYLERDLRIPEGNAGGARFVKFLIPVYKEKEVDEARR